jgi:hypothetical protein
LKAGDPVTVQVELQLESGGSPDLSLGLSTESPASLAQVSKTDSGDVFTSQLRIKGAELQVRDGNRFRTIPVRLQKGKPLTLWVTSDPSSGTWELRMQPLADGDPVQVEVDGQTRFAFRRPAGGEPLRSLVLRANKDNSYKASLTLRFTEKQAPKPPTTYELP